MIDHTVQPFAQPEPTTESEKSASSTSRSSTSRTDATRTRVQEDGSISAGLKWSGWADGDCKGSGLGSQIYFAPTGTRTSGPSCTPGTFQGRQSRQVRYRSPSFWSYAIVWTDIRIPTTRPSSAFRCPPYWLHEARASDI
ncbi:Necrosis inducing protein [Phytophthora cactorum]|nr:Necrosis inducing protein [Phytophthora cactorum]